MKKCPYCAEEIQDEAKVCRFCHMDLNEGKSVLKSASNEPQVKQVEARSRVMDGVRIGVGIFIVLPLIIIIIGLVVVTFFGGIGQLFNHGYEKRIDKYSESLPHPSSLKTTLNNNYMRKKITIPPIDMNKINSPSYISYYQIVREKIRRLAYQNYNRAETGEVYLTFIIKNNGKVDSIKVMDEQSTRGPYLRKIAEEAIEAAAPFPAFPKELEYPQLSFNIVLSYEIE